MKLVTWNVNSIQSRLSHVLKLIEIERPDVLCLQELKCVEEKFPFEEFKAAGFHATVFGQKTYNGVAILSQVPPTEIKKGFGNS